MKLIPNSAFVYLRGVLAVTLLGGALAMAFVATTTVPLGATAPAMPQRPVVENEVSALQEP